MRVVGLVSFRNHAGAQEALIRLKREMRRRGHAFEVWFLYDKAPAAYASEPHTRTLLPTDGRRPPGALGYLTILRRTVDALRAHRPDAVITFLPLAHVVGQTAARLLGVRHRVASQRAPGSTYSLPMCLADRLLGATGFYTAIVAVSHAVAADYAGHPAAYRRRLTVVHNGVDRTPSALSKAEARARLGLAAPRGEDEGAPLLLAIGRMQAQKNYPFMLRAFAGTPRGRLVIAGDGPLRAELDRLAAELGVADRLDRLGNVDRADVPDLLRAADVFLQTSTYEGQSNALLEAMEEGLPVVVSDHLSHAETLRDGADDGAPAGLLLPLDAGPGRWARELTALLDDPDRRDELGRRARARVRRFTPERMAAGFEAALGLSGGGAARPRVDGPTAEAGVPG